MKLDEKRLRELAMAYPIDAETLERARIAAELLAARAVVAAAREADRIWSPPSEDGPGSAAWDRVNAALAAYDDATR